MIKAGMKLPQKPGTGGEEKKKILVGISGGANSAVTAALLKSQGYPLQAVYLQLRDSKATGPGPQFGARCCLTKTEAQAREICRKLDLPLKVVHVEERFEDKVVDPFVHDMLRSRLPNACIPCNLEIRFEALFKAADDLGCELVATGHHAQVFQDAVAPGSGPSSARLLRAVNAQKDQSYFLFGLTQKQLSRLLVPLGGFQDAMIARLAHEFGLPESTPGNPQQPCFIQGREHHAFFESRVPKSLRPGGVIRIADGTLMGEHAGLYSYQPGDRAKLAKHIKDPENYQVVAFDVPAHALIVGSEKERYHAELRANRTRWVRLVDGLHELKTSARFSPSQREAVPCRVVEFENSVLRVEFDEPQKGLIAGQAIVFYDGDEVLGGAIIDAIGSMLRDDQS
jgi:tRNA-specific 2-thiouridylase